ncbi:class I SAM-dependent methyltransferase [Terrilactibacillus laevilacticus]|uniref:class I SAM-dependent methyltransferase n=1 Tax=Terrilactibacillus laevilacticus TaxID=1380157 RepID=UPI001146881E|nr:class I SAM-dependent methyltransferase [Terrilactibacillus laevilacticus]
MKNTEILKINKDGWYKVSEDFFSATSLPVYGPFAPTEDELTLFNDVSNKNILEIGCGSGHSLVYFAKKGANELWGLDLSTIQIETAQKLHTEKHIESYLFVSPMENDPGIPHSHFDIVFSIFALGWTTDLPKTLKNIYDYLKPGGSFIFSWEHPLYSRLNYEEGHFVARQSYISEGRSTKAWHGVPIVMHDRKLSTYINELINVGFCIKKIIEEYKAPVDEGEDDPEHWYSSHRARLVPPTFIIKCVK